MEIEVEPADGGTEEPREQLTSELEEPSEQASMRRSEAEWRKPREGWWRIASSQSVSQSVGPAWWVA
jgi:hypothetical protein